MDELRHDAAGLVVELRRTTGQSVKRKRRIGVVVGIKIRSPVDDRARTVRGCGAIQVDQRKAVDFLMQGRKVVQDFNGTWRLGEIKCSRRFVWTARRSAS